MVDINSVIFSENLTNKLKSQGIDTLTEIEASVVNSIKEGENVLMQHGVNTIVLEACAVNQGENISDMNDKRLGRVLVCTDSSDKAVKVAETIKSLVSDSLSIVLCCERIKMTKNVKILEGPLDIVVGTISRINNLIMKKALKTKNIEQIYCLSYLDECKAALSELIMNLDSSVQKILTCSEVTSDCESVLKKFKGTFQKFQSTSSTISEASSNESVSEDEEAKKISGVVDKRAASDNEESEELEGDANAESNSEDKGEKDDKIEDNPESQEIRENSDDSSDADEKTVQNGTLSDINTEEESKTNNIDAVIIKRVSKVKDFERNKETAKILIESYDDIDLVSKLITICQNYHAKSSDKSKETKIGKQVFTGDNVSRYTGRKGYTAYHLRTNIVCYGKGYVYKTLKKCIDEVIVESISYIQKEKDEMGFVFDLPSEHNEKFMSSWKEGECVVLKVLEGDIPELSDVQNTTNGTSRGRGGNRGGRRGMRGGRGGFKRPGGADLGSKSKFQKV